MPNHWRRDPNPDPTSKQIAMAMVIASAGMVLWVVWTIFEGLSR